jgi:hypothetical protein
MNEDRPGYLKIIDILLKSSLGFILLYFGIKMYFAIPELEELDHTTGTYTSTDKGIRVGRNNSTMLMVEEFHFTKENGTDDLISMTNIQKADGIQKRLAPGDKLTFWYPQHILLSDRGKEMLQLSVNDKVIIPYEPNRLLPILMMCGGVIIIILFILLVKDLLKPQR